jgi:hypothetical protein
MGQLSGSVFHATPVHSASIWEMDTRARISNSEGIIVHSRRRLGKSSECNLRNMHGSSPSRELFIESYTLMPIP